MTNERGYAGLQREGFRGRRVGVRDSGQRSDPAPIHRHAASLGGPMVLVLALVLSSCTDNAILNAPHERPQFTMTECHSSLSLSQCMNLLIAIDDLDVYGLDGCADYAPRLYDRLTAGKIRYNPDVATAQAFNSAGIIEIGPMIENGDWERVFMLVHEEHHIWHQTTHSCEPAVDPGCTMPRDATDEAGLDCAKEALHR